MGVIYYLLIVWIIYSLMRTRGEVDFEIILFDLWIGFYYDHKKDILYFCPFPCCVFIGYSGDKERGEDILPPDYLI